MTNEELVMKIKSGELGAEGMQQLYDQNRGLIMFFVNRYRRYSDEAQAEGEGQYMDLKQEAFLALYEAVNYFKPDGGANFVTISSMFIKKALRKYSYKAYGVTIPEYAVSNINHYKDLVENFIKEHGRKPKDEELVDPEKSEYYYSLKAVQEIKRQATILDTVSLDMPATNDSEGDTLGDLQADPGPAVEEAVTDQIADEEIRAELWEAVDELPEKQADVLRMRYRDGMSCEATGAALGVSRQAVNQLEHKGRDRIRDSKHGRSLRKRCLDAGYFTRINAVSGTSLKTWRHSGYSAPERIVINAMEGIEDLPEVDLNEDL